MKNKWLILLIGFMLVALPSCKKSSEIGKSGLTTLDQRKRFQETLAGEVDYTTFQAKVDLSLNSSSKNMSVKGSVKLIRDKKFQISITPFLGIEMFRAEISNDTILIIDRINKRYLLQSITEYRKMSSVPVDLSMLEALFMNKIFMPGNSTLSEGDFSRFDWITEFDGNLRGRLKKSDPVNIDFLINTYDHLIKTSAATKSGNHCVEWEYSDFKEIFTTTFPHKSNIKYWSANKELKVGITYSKVEFDKNITIETSIPKSYDKLEMAEIIRLLMK